MQIAHQIPRLRNFAAATTQCLRTSYETYASSTSERSNRAVVAEWLVAASVAGDALFASLAMVVAFWMRSMPPLSGVGIQLNHDLNEYAGHIVFGTCLMIGMFFRQQVYDVQALLHLRRALRRIVEAVLLWAAVFLFGSLVFKTVPAISRIYVATAGVISLLLVCSWRILFHSLIQAPACAAMLRQRILVVGWNSDSEKLLDRVKNDPANPFEIVGWIPAERDGAASQSVFDAPGCLGEADQLLDIMHRERIDAVILSDMHVGPDAVLKLAKTCEREFVKFTLVPSCFQVMISGLSLQNVSGVPVLGVSQLPLNRPFNRCLKRLVDIVGGAIGLALSMPLIGLFGAFVYLESPGPILYRQRRTGRNGRDFFIFKIRSMRVDAEKNGKVGWSTKDDPRRLRIGAFMRKWNIDEIPQFWNVLKGDMSLVGPRPERPELIHNFRYEIENYNARHAVKPGITGWAQVSGFRGDTDLQERIRYDLYYMENWSLLFDLQIMAMTFFKHKNAC